MFIKEKSYSFSTPNFSEVTQIAGLIAKQKRMLLPNVIKYLGNACSCR